MTNRYTYTPASLLGLNGKISPFNCIHAASKMLTLKDDDARALADAFAFSGGEIDNIVRKSTIMEVLNGAEPDLQALKRLCKEEKMHGDNVRIGFS